MNTTVKQMVEAADAVVPRISPAQAKEIIARGDALVVDVRDASEVAKEGKVAGAINVSRGLLEFKADPFAAGYDPQFHKDHPVIVYCASGGRSALSGKALKELGFSEVYNLGGFKDWVAAGGEIDPPTA
ncbi:MAG: rhodanese [Actinobacteria bacterium HGW-Actinobacteria-5]|jgi:rhodanese-related sulfurtransferase|nr:MAG: rhodanese [Actinobacteria bacterium HGW-Actinobacteria-5]